LANNSPNLGKINTVILHSESHSSEIEIIPTQANSDDKVFSLWLHGRSRHTQKAYSTDINRLFGFVDKNLKLITLGNLQEYVDNLIDSGLKESTQHRMIASVKSLFSFSQKIGYIKYNPAQALISPKFKDELSERILSEAEVQRIIGLENNPRNKLLLRVLYAGGIRVSELCRLKWSDLQDREKGGQMSIFGKRGKTNHIIIPEPLWSDLMMYKKDRLDDAPVFVSRKGGHLSCVQVWRIVKNSARQAGIKKEPSPHWFRHAHASHALDRGAKISLVKETLNHSSVQTTGKYLHAKPGECSSTYLNV